MLLCAALIWGSSFIVMKNAVAFLTPAVLLMIRFVLASFFLGLLYFKKLKTFPKEKILYSLLTGCLLFVAYYIQTWGLRYTTPGKNAFLTAIYCVFVPFLVWLFYKKRPSIYNFIAALMTVLGLGCIFLESILSEFVLNIGDILTLCAGVLYALHIMMIKKYGEGVDSGVFTAVQFVGASFISIFVSLIVEDVTIISQIQPHIYFQVLYLAFFATGIAMLFQTIGQMYTTECQSSIILSLESVFGVLFSVLFYGEVVTFPILIGFVVIFMAIIISETELSFLKISKGVKSLLVFFLLLTLVPVHNVEAAELTLNAPYAYIYDTTTNQELYAKNAHKKIYPASMTKVMTALVALDHIENLDEIVTIKKYDLKGLWEAGASTANLEVGEKVTYLDLLHGIILPSGADACRAMSRLLFGSEEKMAEQMNKKAKELGLKNTHFVNTSGLHDDNHYTTAYDMAMITKEALKNKTFKKIFSTRSYRTSTTNHYMAASILKLHWRSHLDISHIVGCKTGYTSNSKSCLTCLVKSQKNDIVCVFAKENGSGKYIEDSKTVINYLNKNYHPITILNKEEKIYEVNIVDGEKDTYEFYSPRTVQYFMHNSVNKEEFTVEYVEETRAIAPIEAPLDIGKIQIKYKDEVLDEMTVTIDENIDATKEAKRRRFIEKYGIMIAVIMTILIIFIILLMRKRKKMKELRYQEYRLSKEKQKIDNQ